MDEKRPPTDRFEPEEEGVRRLLEGAGPRPPLPQEDLDSIRSAVASAWRFQARRRARAVPRRPVWPLAAALAAALALAAGLAWWWLTQGSPPVPGGGSVIVARLESSTGPVYIEVEGDTRRALGPREAVPAGATLSTPGDGEAGRASLLLASGATLRLDTGTRLRMASASELALAEGAVYADTGAPPGPGARTEPSLAVATPLAVDTPLGRARDIGTRFAVRLDPDAQALSVQVRDGAVAVEASGATYVTPAGQELVLSGDGRAERRELAAYGPGWEWVLAAAAGFEVEGRSLEQFLAWVSHETGWQVRFEEGALTRPASEIVLHGAIGNLPPDQAVFAVLPGAGLDGKLEGETLVIRSRG